MNPLTTRTKAAILIVLMLSPVYALRGQEETAGSWADVLALAGVSFQSDEEVENALGPLPDESKIEKAGNFTASRFMEIYKNTGDDEKLIMERSVRSRLRELYRRGALDGKLAQVMGHENAGVPGSQTFNIPPVPAESYHALISYIEFSAMLVPGSEFRPSPEARARIDRALQASLAISSPEVRSQYWGFDVAWSSILAHWVCEDDREEMIPGMLWLYASIIDTSSMDFLPAPPEGLAGKIRVEGGALFAEGREELRDMPGDISAITWWECAE